MDDLVFETVQTLKSSEAARKRRNGRSKGDMPLMVWTSFVEISNPTRPKTVAMSYLFIVCLVITAYVSCHGKI